MNKDVMSGVAQLEQFDEELYKVYYICLFIHTYLEFTRLMVNPFNLMAYINIDSSLFH